MPADHLPPLRFAFLTPIYDWVVGWSSAEARFRPALVELVAAHDPRHVLEIGCGTGTLTLEMARRLPAARVVGLDADAGALRLARAKARHGDGPAFLTADARRLPELPQIDAVVASLFFHHLDREGRKEVLAQVRRVLRADGRLFVADWAPAQSRGERLRFQAVRLLDGYARTAAHARGAFAAEIEAAGFALEEGASFGALVGRIRLWSARKSP